MIDFTSPKSIENSLLCLNKHSESIRNNESSKLIKTDINKNTLNIVESLNPLNTNVIKNPEYTGNFSLDNNLSTNTKVANVEKFDVPLNNIVTKNNNIMENVCAPKKENGANPKSKFFNTENTIKIPTFSKTNSSNELTTNMNNFIEKEDMCLNDNDHLNEVHTSESSKDYVKNTTNPILKTNDELIEDNDNILSNHSIHDSNLSETIIESKNYIKPTKLNMVTTEPYPKYTPTVEKAIKKYENKQPKKECIVM